jgi:hypothetical protein
MVAAAIVGSAVVGGIVQSNAASDAADANRASTAAAADASRERLALDRERFDFEKSQWNDNAANRAYAADVARQVGDRQLRSMDQQYGIADDYWNYQKNTFRPLEQGLVQQASEYDTQARRESEAAAAGADVTRSFANQDQQNARLAGRYGLNSNRFADTIGTTGIAKAALTAGAMNKARRDVETKGFAMKMDAAGLGRNLATNQNSAVTTAMTAGNNSVTNSMVPVSIARTATADMSGAYGNLSSGLGNFGASSMDLAKLQANNFYDSQKFGMNAGAGVASAIMKGYGMYTGQYNPFA